MELNTLLHDTRKLGHEQNIVVAPVAICWEGEQVYHSGSGGISPVPL